jgi:hypothetical protein
MKILNVHIGNRTRDLLTRGAVIEVSALLGVYEASIGSKIPKFRCKMSSPQSKPLDWLVFESGTIVRPEIPSKRQRINAE